MITGLRTTTARRRIADRPLPSHTLPARDAMALRAAFGPGYQAAASEAMARIALRR